MEIIVQKFGGTSVSNVQMLYKCSEHIIREYESGKGVVVVVSAQGKTTNNLIKEGKEITEVANEREHDVLISTGEQITIAKLCMCLENIGYQAKSFTGWQLPIVTDNNYGDADIVNIETGKIMEELKKGVIPVVAGFQGVSKDGDITTLGRGGSDTTAVHLAASLKATACDVYKDVEGVYEDDPNKVKSTKKYDVISYDEMLKMSNKGAKVLHNKCIKVAKKYNVKVQVKSIFGDGRIGTLIT